MSDPVDRLALDKATDLLKEHGFDQFAEILRDAYDDVMSKWVDVKSRQPDPGTFVLAWHAGWRRAYVVRFGVPLPEEWDLAGVGEWRNPSHWMKLPPPPVPTPESPGSPGPATGPRAAKEG